MNCSDERASRIPRSGARPIDGPPARVQASARTQDCKGPSVLDTRSNDSTPLVMSSAAVVGRIGL